MEVGVFPYVPFILLSPGKVCTAVQAKQVVWISYIQKHPLITITPLHTLTVYTSGAVTKHFNYQLYCKTCAMVK